MAMRVYIDNVSVVATFTNSINTSVPVGVGSHNVVVQAWDSTGAVFKSAETITVGSAPPPPPPPTTSAVTVSSPANNATVTSPMHVVAAAAAGHPITAMQIYLDNVSVFANSSGSLDTQVNAAAGLHSLVVQAWDSAGGIYKQAMTVTVSGSTPTPTPTGGVPAGAITKSHIEKMTGWENCTVCAGAGGNGPSAVFSMQQNQVSPSLTGSSIKFNIAGTTPFSDALWWKQLGGDNTAKNFKYDLDFYLTNPGVAQALEFDVNQSNGTHKFIFGTQCDLKGTKAWDVWMGANPHWTSTGVPCPVPAAFTWHHLTWEFQRNDTQVTFIAITLDGVKHYVNKTYTAIAGGATEVNVAFQMDGDSAQHAYSTWLDNVTLSYW